jgi:hypothetical protein
VPHFLYPFLCWGTSGFFSASGCYEHSGEYVLITWRCIFWVYAQELPLVTIAPVELCPVFWGMRPDWFTEWVHQLAVSPAMEECSSFSTSSPASAVTWIFHLSHWMVWLNISNASYSSSKCHSRPLITESAHQFRASLKASWILPLPPTHLCPSYFFALINSGFLLVLSVGMSARPCPSFFLLWIACTWDTLTQTVIVKGCREKKM